MPASYDTTEATLVEATTRRRVDFNIDRIRRDFPILRRRVRGKALTYLDSAATAQKPQVVIDAIMRYYTEQNANIHRAVHHLSEVATEAYEAARVTVQQFLNAASRTEIIFTRGTTEAINLVAASYGRMAVQAGDEVLISAMEHHSNIVPWQLLCEATGARLHVAPIDNQGQIIVEAFRELLTERTKIVALVHVSNSLGTINPVRELIELAHAAGAVVLIDGAQAVPHMQVDVQELDADFYAFSGHKVFGPTGIGILYGKENLLESMPPYQGGGDMIKSVTFEKTIFNDLPYRFEAGTPHIAGVIGLAVALEYVGAIGYEQIGAHESALLRYAQAALADIPGVRIIGTAAQKAGVISFVMEDIHPHDVGTILDREGIAIRTGHHCTQPVMQRFSVPATSRASFALYNAREDVDRLVAGLHMVRQVFC